jgi:endonuclease/exonuclease/phosphatase family metal-dependent hydrolase
VAWLSADGLFGVDPLGDGAARRSGGGAVRPWAEQVPVDFIMRSGEVARRVLSGDHLAALAVHMAEDAIMDPGRGSGKVGAYVPIADLAKERGPKAQKAAGRNLMRIGAAIVAAEDAAEPRSAAAEPKCMVFDLLLEFQGPATAERVLPRGLDELAAELDAMPGGKTAEENRRGAQLAAEDMMAGIENAAPSGSFVFERAQVLYAEASHAALVARGPDRAKLRHIESLAAQVQAFARRAVTATRARATEKLYGVLCEALALHRELPREEEEEDDDEDEDEDEEDDEDAGGDGPAGNSSNTAERLRHLVVMIRTCQETLRRVILPYQRAIQRTGDLLATVPFSRIGSMLGKGVGLATRQQKKALRTQRLLLAALDELGDRPLNIREWLQKNREAWDEMFDLLGCAPEPPSNSKKAEWKDVACAFRDHLSEYMPTVLMELDKGEVLARRLDARQFAGEYIKRWFSSSKSSRVRDEFAKSMGDLWVRLVHTQGVVEIGDLAGHLAFRRAGIDRQLLVEVASQEDSPVELIDLGAGAREGDGGSGGVQVLVLRDEHRLVLAPQSIAESASARVAVVEARIRGRLEGMSGPAEITISAARAHEILGVWMIVLSDAFAAIAGEARLANDADARSIFSQRITLMELFRYRAMQFLSILRDVVFVVRTSVTEFADLVGAAAGLPRNSEELLDKVLRDALATRASPLEIDPDAKPGAGPRAGLVLFAPLRLKRPITLVAERSWCERPAAEASSSSATAPPPSAAPASATVVEEQRPGADAGTTVTDLNPNPNPNHTAKQKKQKRKDKGKGKAGDEARGAPQDVTVATYNVLAPHLLPVPDPFSNWSQSVERDPVHRESLVMASLTAGGITGSSDDQLDICALQEVGPGVALRLQAALSKAGYESVHTHKLAEEGLDTHAPSGDKADTTIGNLLAWRSDTWTLLKRTVLDVGTLIAERVPEDRADAVFAGYANAAKHIKALSTDKQVRCRAPLVHLQHRRNASIKVAVVAVHLASGLRKNSGDFRRVLQADALVRRLEGELCGAGRLPLILLGDFNSVQGDPAHALAIQGRWDVSAGLDRLEPRPNEEQVARMREYFATGETPATRRMRSAYAEVMGGEEAKVTNWMAWRDAAPSCVDYIFLAGEHIEATHALVVPSVPEHEAAKEGGGWPDKIHPSDHLPVAVKVRLSA